IRLQCGYSSDAYSFGEIDKKIDTGNTKKVQSSLSENGSLNYEVSLCIKLALRLESRSSRDGILTLRITGMPDCWRACHTLHSRIHRFEDKLMDLEPHDPYAKTVKRVAVLAEEQTKTTEKENLDNKRQRISKIFRMLLDFLHTRVNLKANVPIFEKDQYLCIIELAIIYSRTDVVEDHSTLRKDRDWPGLDYQRPFQ
ncbi:hypothetical protein Tco_1225664, partial [Tanacetum coccineum]